MSNWASAKIKKQTEVISFQMAEFFFESYISDIKEKQDVPFDITFEVKPGIYDYWYSPENIQDDDRYSISGNVGGEFMFILTYKLSITNYMEALSKHKKMSLEEASDFLNKEIEKYLDVIKNEKTLELFKRNYVFNVINDNKNTLPSYDYNDYPKKYFKKINDNSIMVKTITHDNPDAIFVYGILSCPTTIIFDLRKRHMPISKILNRRPYSVSSMIYLE